MTPTIDSAPNFVAIAIPLSAIARYKDFFSPVSTNVDSAITAMATMATGIASL